MCKVVDLVNLDAALVFSQIMSSNQALLTTRERLKLSPRRAILTCSLPFSEVVLELSVW